MKRFSAWLLAFLLAFSLLGLNAEAAKFSDLYKTERFYEEIKYLIEEGIISGYPDESFQPSGYVTRGEAAIMIGRLLDLDGTQRATKFKDVGKSLKASGYIASATEKGIISGYENGTYRPDHPISRGDMAIILSRAFDLGQLSAFKFKDVGEQMTAAEHIGKLAASSITAGYPDHTFRPGQNVTRAQFSAFLARWLEVEFQQKAAIENSYAWNKTKQYTFNSESGSYMLTYKKAEPIYGLPIGYAWEMFDFTEEKVTETFYLEESYQGLSVGYPYSNYDYALLYPIKVGETWRDYNFSVNKVTAANQTVKTPFKTFTGAVEVTSEGGVKAYYVKNVGFVKSVHSNGRVLTELIDIK